MISSFVALHRSHYTIAVNPNLVRIVCEDQAKKTTIHFKAHNTPKAEWLQVTESVEDVLSAFNGSMGSGGRQVFAMAHDKWNNLRYAFNPALVQAISQDEKGRTFLVFDGIDEVETFLTISESISEIMTECNRAMQARSGTH